MITERIIENLCGILRIDKNELFATLHNVHKQGYVFPNDIRHLTELGIPVVKSLSNILNAPEQRVCELFTKITNEETLECSSLMTYEDLLIVLGIIAQNFEIMIYRLQGSEIHWRKPHEVI